MNQMGNLEKLGILVIVILVVVVGVVAITPKDQVDEALFPTDEQAAPAPLDPAAPEVADASAQPKFPGVMSNVVDPSAPAGQDPAGPVVDRNGLPLPPTPAPAPVAPEAIEYVVVKGDTGASIAKKLLGSPNRWPEIVAVNPGLDARRLKIGQKIQVPAKATDTAVLTPVTPVGGSSPSAVSGPGGAPGGTALTPPVTPTPEVAASERTYVVQRGDTLSDIARRELGSASKYVLIRDANSDVLHGTDVVRPGMKLRIPSVASARTAASTPSTQTPASPAASGKTYKVQPGDTLTSIAARFLGSSSRWKEIQKANPSLQGSTNLRVGVELTLPDDVSAR